MPYSRLPALVLTALPFVGATAATADDRMPTSQELAKIEDTLAAAGYTSWDDVELDDGVWDVDEARKDGDTRDYDVEIDPQSWQIVSERED